MSDVKLTARTGRTHGTRPSRRLRAEDLIPGVVYGLGIDPVSVAVDRRDLRVALSTDAGLNAVLALEVDGSSTMAVVKDVQRHPVRREVTHVDFLRVDPDARIEVDVPIHLEGEASEVTQQQGIAEQRLMALTVSTKPGDIPDGIVVDITDMTLDKTITAADLPLPAGVELVTPEDQVVVSAELTRAALVSEEEEAAELAEAQGEIPEPAAGGDDATDGEDGDGDGE